MAYTTESVTYVPGIHAGRKPSSAEMAGRYIREWDQRQAARTVPPPDEMPPTICFSRKIGVGALEIADILAERIGYDVVDRQILEFMADRGKLSEETVGRFDERYPGRRDEMLAYLFGEKSFTQSGYTRLLFSSVIAMARMSPTIFVGRGTHLILPREGVLAVRCTASSDFRAQRLVSMLKIKASEAREQLTVVDREQADFFRKVYGKKMADSLEFDLVINCETMSDPARCAAVVEAAFRAKFGERAVAKAA